MQCPDESVCCQDYSFSFIGNSNNQTDVGFQCLLGETPKYGKYDYTDQISLNNIKEYWNGNKLLGGGTINDQGPIKLQRDGWMGPWTNEMNTPLGG